MGDRDTNDRMLYEAIGSILNKHIPQQGDRIVVVANPSDGSASMCARAYRSSELIVGDITKLGISGMEFLDLGRMFFQLREFFESDMKQRCEQVLFSVQRGGKFVVLPLAIDNQKGAGPAEQAVQTLNNFEKEFRGGVV